MHTVMLKRMPVLSFRAFSHALENMHISKLGIDNVENVHKMARNALTSALLPLEFCVYTMFKIVNVSENRALEPIHQDRQSTQACTNQ